MAKPNIIFIIVDALRYDFLDYPNVYNIRKIAEAGTLFTNAFSCTNSTDASITSIFSGKNTLNHGIILYGDSGDRGKIMDVTFLPEVLRSDGYYTVALDWLGKWHKKGYDDYVSIRQVSKRYSFINNMKNISKFIYDKLQGSFIWNRLYNLRSHLNLPLYPPADVVTDHAVTIIKDIKEPFFLYIHYWDPHTPYNPPSKYSNQYNDPNLNSTISSILTSVEGSSKAKYVRSWTNPDDRVVDIVSRYRGEVSFVDEEIGRILKVTKEIGIDEDTIFLFTADHGESMTEHGIYFDHHGLYDVTVKVPLILKGPGISNGNIVTELVQHTDIMPTLLKLINVEYDGSYDGKDISCLLNGEENEIHEYIFFEESFCKNKKAIRNSKYKYIYSKSNNEAMCQICNIIHGGELEELYDVIKDNKEINNIVNDEDDIKNLLKNQLISWIPKMKNCVRGLSYNDEKEILERLKKLGYL